MNIQLIPTKICKKCKGNKWDSDSGECWTCKNGGTSELIQPFDYV